MMNEGVQPHVSPANEPPVYFLGLPSIVRATGRTTNGAFGLTEHRMMPPGFASPYHTHRLEDEAFYVLEGEMAFVCDGRWTIAGSGTYVFGPRNIPHGFKVLGDAPASMLLLCTPGGFEQFIVELSEAAPAPPDMAKLAAVAAKYQVDIHGPLPEGPQERSTGSAPVRDLKGLNRRWLEAFNARDWQTETAVRAADFRAHVSGAPQTLDAQAWAGFMSAFTTAFPDSQISVEACIAEGDSVATRWSLTGTHKGEFQGIAPTGRAVRFSGIEFNRVADGRIAEHWAVLDNAALLTQLGAIGG